MYRFLPNTHPCTLNHLKRNECIKKNYENLICQQYYRCEGKIALIPLFFGVK